MPGPDIFLSYNREDSDRAKQFAEGFAAQGLEVWWDVALRSGEAYDKVTEDALRGAKAVVVLWSRRSVDSRWVRAEATLAERRKTLMPAMIEECERPIMFELTQTADLTHWRGDREDTSWRDFARHVCEFVGKEAQSHAAIAEPEKPLPGLDQLAVVVLPFANMSSDADQEYFADGITEDIITDLSQISALRVISRNSSFTFKGKHVDIPAVSRQLNVTHVLEGSVRRAGNRVRVTAQLIDGSSNDHVWAQRYDRDLDDIFELQDELSKAIVDALKVKLLPKEKKAISERGTNNAEAYDLYLRGQAALRNGNLDDAIAFGKKAVELDPRFLQAWSLLSVSYIQAAVTHPEDADRLRELSAEANDEAVAIDPESVLAHAARLVRAITADRDFFAARAAFERIKTEFNSSVIPMFQPMIFLVNTGNTREALDYYEQVLRSDPLSMHPLFAFALASAGRMDEAAAERDRLRRLRAVPILVEYFAFLRDLVCEETSVIEEQMERHFAINPDYMPIHRELMGKMADKEAVLALVRKAHEDEYYHDPGRLLGVSHLAAYSDDHELVLACLHEALVKRNGLTLAALWHPLAAGARRLEGFKDIVRGVGLADYYRRTGNWGDYARPIGDDDFEMIA